MNGARIWAKFVRDAATIPARTGPTIRGIGVGHAGAFGSVVSQAYGLPPIASDWLAALALRDPAPVAVIGGWSSDRAIELAELLSRQTEWSGDRPLLFITAAADVIQSAGI